MVGGVSSGPMVFIANYATAFSPATIAARCIRLPAMGDHRRGHIATDRSWTGIRLQQKRADVLPFSHARSIMEIYDLDAGYFDWRTSPLGGPGESPWFPVEEVDDDRQLLERAVELADVSLVGGARLLTLANTVGGALGRSGEQIPEDPVAECENDREIPFRGTARPSAGGNGGFVELHVETSEDSTALTYDFGELSSSFVGVEVSLPAGGAVDLVHADRIGDDGTIGPARVRVALRGAPVLPARANPPGVLRAVLRALPQGDRAAGARVHAPRRVPAPVPVPRPPGRDISVQRWQTQPDLRGSQAHPAGQHG